MRLADLRGVRSLRTPLLVLLLGVSTLVMQRYVGGETIYKPENTARRDSLHEWILANRLPPGRTWADYGAKGFNVRALTVYLAEGIHRVTGLSVRRTYFAIDTIALFACLLALFAFLRGWVDPPLALIGVLYAALILPLTYALHVFHPWDRLSLLVWIGLLYLLRGRRFAAFAALLVIGVLVKYDVVPLPGLYFLANARRDNLRPVALTTLLLLGLSFGTYLALVAHFGSGMGSRDIGTQVVRNLSDIREFHVWYPPLLAFGTPIVLAVLGFRAADRFARSAAGFAILLAIALFLLVNFAEVRTEMPLLVLLLPCALVGLQRCLFDRAVASPPAR